MPRITGRRAVTKKEKAQLQKLAAMLPQAPAHPVCAVKDGHQLLKDTPHINVKGGDAIDPKARYKVARGTQPVNHFSRLVQVLASEGEEGVRRYMLRYRNQPNPAA
ncbi:hypothetical protein SAMN05421823_102525 [Catalinimonas alkaloidigena]|uniref:Uncharacterized protein n=1 Tax=Catalinimonas alkaloidigena TaxID=1075417 RepID=A0A1G9B659_9BACT|nr:hypothetical protein [Catalinimonas alkaloidigena]SDK35002.1 hypothetical protein SAMN05421823_102525 [Catalinimonas alkaloidigena]